MCLCISLLPTWAYTNASSAPSPPTHSQTATTSSSTKCCHPTATAWLRFRALATSRLPRCATHWPRAKCLAPAHWPTPPPCLSSSHIKPAKPSPTSSTPLQSQVLWTESTTVPTGIWTIASCSRALRHCAHTSPDCARTTAATTAHASGKQAWLPRRRCSVPPTA